jgi:hypothetical protein
MNRGSWSRSESRERAIKIAVALEAEGGAYEAIAAEMWELLGRCMAPSQGLETDLKDEIRETMHRYEQFRFGVT